MFKSDIGVPLPRRQTVRSAGYDFYAPCAVTVPDRGKAVIDTGIYIEPGTKVDFGNGPTDEWMFMLVPRSGAGSKFGTRFLNTVGVIDSDYTGPDNTIKAVMRMEADLLDIKEKFAVDAWKSIPGDDGFDRVEEFRKRYPSHYAFVLERLDESGPDKVYTYMKGLLDRTVWEVKAHDRFIQGMFIPYGKVVGEIPPTSVRTGGHGSTGV